jgi:hypothetical protein
VSGAATWRRRTISTYAWPATSILEPQKPFAGQITHFDLGLDSAASLQAVVPKGTFGQFQPNAPPFESVHTLEADVDPSPTVLSRRRPAVEISGEESDPAEWREAF